MSALLEREAEMARLSELVDSVAHGTGKCVLIEGAPGIGKTELVRFARARARQAGLLVLSAQGGELEREMHLGLVRQLLEPALVGASEEALAPLFAGAADVARVALGLGSARAGGASDPFAVLHGLYWLCANLAARQPLLLAVDDAHWSDPQSLRWLSYLARRVEDVPVLIVMAARHAEPGAANGLLEQVLEDSAVLRLLPNPLGEDGVTHLVRGNLDPAASTEFCRACHVATGGNPFLVHELTRGARVRHIAAVTSEACQVSQLATEPVARLVLARLSRLGAAATGLARATAILGSDARLHHAAALAGLDDEQAVAAAHALRSTQIFSANPTPAFEHPLVRTAVYDDIDASVRSRQHRQAAQVLAGEGAPRGRVASHLLAADPHADPWVVERLRVAAGEALEAGAPDAAARYLERALEEPPSTGLRAAVLEELGQALFSVDPTAAAKHLASALSLTKAEGPRTSIALALAKALSFGLRMRECVDVIEQAIQESPGISPELRLHMESQLLLWAFWADNDRRAAHAARLHQLSAGLSGSTSAERAILGLQAWDLALSSGTLSEALGTARRSVGSGLEFVEPAPGFEVAIMVSFVFVYCDQVDEALRLLEDGIGQLRSAGWLVHQALAYAHRSHAELYRGALFRAEADARTSWQLAVQLGPGSPAWWFSIANLVQVLVARGIVGEAAELAERTSLGEGLPETVIVPQPMMVRGELRIAQGRFGEGIDDLLAAGAWMEQRGFTNPPFGAWRSLVAPVLAGTGRRDEAREIISEGVARARRFGAPSALGAALRSAGLVEGGEPGLELLRESVAVLGTSPASHEHAHSLVELGAFLRRHNRRSEARAWLDEGLTLAERCGASGLMQLARAELAASGVRPGRRAVSGLGALTASEHRVARMAVDGRSNVEVAQSLFVSQKTIEKHLTSVYRKLGISSRAELANTPGISGPGDGFA